MAQFEKHFTLEEARDCLPSLRKRFERIHSLYSEMQSLQADFIKVQMLIQANGNAPKETGFESRVTELQRQVQEIVDSGIEVKDVGRGLIDFPHWRDGEEVFLCWELAEDDIRFWHRIEDGYAGRSPL